ncbi:MAG: sodium:proton antiporter [SAR324 cluster bacterium]|nr:sodium:proton antiporter [SAR324 cluster bacterium]
MHESLLVGLTLIIAIGAIGQWIAWRLRLPSILLLLILGFAVGPLTGWIDPDALFGKLLFPLVSISVAIILFEGGLSLQISELKKIGNVVWRLITAGALVTWITVTGFAHFFLGLTWSLASLFGAILIVTGPTVITPLLQHIRPSRQVSAIAKWEGITIDPVGAVFAVLVFEAILADQPGTATLQVGFALLKTIVIGVFFGFSGAWLLAFLFKRYWIPGFLQNAATLAVVIGGYTVSDLLQHESGLLTVTLLGIVLANQKSVNLKPIIDFKENLRVLLIPSLFILLTARLNIEDLVAQFNFNLLWFLAALILFVRPAAVFFSTFFSHLNWKQSFFLAWLAPRGIVAAAVSSVFALNLEMAGMEAGSIVPFTFLVIAATVTIYGLTASPVARILGVAQPHAQGVLFVGADPMVQSLAAVLKKEKIPVMLVDSNWQNISAARMAGLSTYYGSILSEHILDDLELGGIGRLVAFTNNPEVNSLATLHFAELFGREEVYQLAPPNIVENRNESVSIQLRGRILFGNNITFDFLASRFHSGSTIKATPLTDEFDLAAFKERYKKSATPLFAVDSDHQLYFFSTDSPKIPQGEIVLISMIDPETEEGLKNDRKAKKI